MLKLREAFFGTFFVGRLPSDIVVPISYKKVDYYLEINCGSPGILPHGWLEGSRTTLHAVVTFRCEEGMTFSGPSYRTICQADGRWSHPVPRCYGETRILIGKLGFSLNFWIDLGSLRPTLNTEMLEFNIFHFPLYRTMITTVAPFSSLHCSLHLPRLHTG